MAQIQPLNNNEPIITDPRSFTLHQVSTVSHHDKPVSVQPKKCNALKMKCFALASLILIVLTVAVVVPLSLNRSQPLTETKTTAETDFTPIGTCKFLFQMLWISMI